MLVWMFAIGAVIVGALALLPGSLGIMKLTYRLAASPRGAFFVFKASPLLYTLGLFCLAASLWLAFQSAANEEVAISAGVLFLAITTFGFIMHVSFMFRPVRKPTHISLDEAIKRFGEDEEIVGVLDANGRPHAYVARLQRRPHVVYETDVGAPFISTHCILAHSSMAYELSGEFSNPRICVSSALANNLVFYEKKTNWTVQQVYNATRDGAHRLKAMPTVMTSLRSWKRLYPDSSVWVREKEWRDTFYLKLLARASVIDPKSPDLVYPLQHEVDPRLPLKSFVNGVSLGDEAKAYPIELVRQNAVIEDVVGGEPLVFLSSSDADFVQLYSRRLQDGQVAQFRAGEKDSFEDLATGSVWALDGRCVSGNLAGQHLKPIPHYNKIFWFCWADFFPATEIYTGEPGKAEESQKIDQAKV